MANINDILSNLNAGYEEVTDLIPDKRVFVDDFSSAKNEYGQRIGYSPLGSKMIVLSSGKYLWVGIDGSNQDSKNVRRYNSDFTLDENFVGPTFPNGNDGFVRDVVELSNGKLVIVGHFDGKIMRLNSDGSQDVSFNTGLGFDNNALAVELLSGGSLLVGGSFNGYDGVNTGRFVKLNSDGTLDSTFTSNANINNNVYDIKVDSSGKVYVVGDFANGIVRLNADGTVDTAFDVGSGFNSRVNSIGLDSNGKVLVGGWFNNYKGVECNPGIVRLETNGDLDATFTTEGSGLNYNSNGIVQCLAVQSDNKVVVGGWFNQYDGNRQGHIIRFNTNGTKDTTFDTGYGFGDSARSWEAQRVQSILVHNSKVICVGNMENYGGVPLYGFAKLSLTGDLDSERLFRYTSFGINDGYDDMYDGGSFINTNLTQPFDDIAEDNVNEVLSVPNTHSAAINEGAFEQEDSPTYEPPMDGQVVDGDDYFGEGSSYFTNYYPGMYTMVATNIDIEEFSIGGDLGTDDDNQNDSTILVVHEGATYTVLVKVTREGSGGENYSPSVNHIIIVPGNSEGLTQIINPTQEDDYDDHCVRGLTGRNAIAYLVVARQTSDWLSYEDAEAIAVKFLDVIGGLSSTQTYNYDFSPQVVSYYGEGGLDTAVVIENGIRRSIQRTGYFELVNADGGRKIVSVNDGETVTDEPETPVVYTNPAGNPYVQG